MLNSPFLDWNLPKAVKRFAIPLVSLVGAVLPPDIPVHQTPDPAYGMSLKDCEYRREWKPDILPDPDTGWVRAIYTAQRELRRRSIKAPVLLMHSGTLGTQGRQRRVLRFGRRHSRCGPTFRTMAAGSAMMSPM